VKNKDRQLLAQLTVLLCLLEFIQQKGSRAGVFG